MRPPPRLSMIGVTSCMRVNGAWVLTANWYIQSSRESSRNRFDQMSPVVAAALLMRTSTPPNRSTAASTRRPRSSGSGQVGLDRERAAAHVLDLGQRLVQGAGKGSVRFHRAGGEHQLRPSAGERLRRLPADSPTGPGNDHDLAGQIQFFLSLHGGRPPRTHLTTVQMEASTGAAPCRDFSRHARALRPPGRGRRTGPPQGAAYDLPDGPCPAAHPAPSAGDPGEHQVTRHATRPDPRRSSIVGRRRLRRGV